MNFSLTFKTSDVLEQLCDVSMSDSDRHKAKQLASKFVKWQECITVEFDTDTGLVAVLPSLS